MFCPGGGGGANITSPSVADLTLAISSCRQGPPAAQYFLVPGEEADLQYELPTGTTYARYASGPGAGAPRHPQGIPLLSHPLVV